MTRWTYAGGTAVALIFAAQAGWSLTAQEAWESWKSAADSYGYVVSTEAEEAGDGRVTVRGLNASAAMEDQTFSAMVDEITFTESGDGAVDIAMSETVQMTMSGKDGDGQKIDAALSMSQPGLKVTAQDSDAGAAFSYDAPVAKVVLDSLQIDDQDVPATATLDLSGMSGSYTFVAGDLSDFTSEAKIDNAALALDVTAPEGQGSLDLDLSVGDIRSSASGKNIPMLDEAEPENLFENGFGVTVAGGFGPVDLTTKVDEGGLVTEIAAAMSGGHLDGEFSGEKLHYDIGYEGLSLMARGGQLPVPEVSAALDIFGVSFTIPVQPSEDASPVGIRYAMEGLTLGEGIWSMIDPEGALSHEPASIILEIAGKAKMLLNIFDEENLATGAVPGELEMLDLKELSVQAAGASLEGSGGFTFNNEDLQTFNGMPRPEGSVKLRLVGGNALLDGLTKIGVVPQEQVMMVRMFQGMLAVPGPGEDELSSEVAIDAEGKILINGAPLPF